MGAKCGECGSSDLSDVRAFNMLMNAAAEKIASAVVSAGGDDDNDAR